MRDASLEVMARVRYFRGAANGLSGAWVVKRADISITPPFPPKTRTSRLCASPRAATARDPRSTSPAPSTFLPGGYFQCEGRTNKGNPREHHRVHLQRQNKAPAGVTLCFFARKLPRNDAHAPVR